MNNLILITIYTQEIFAEIQHRYRRQRNLTYIQYACVSFPRDTLIKAKRIKISRVSSLV